MTDLDLLREYRTMLKAAKKTKQAHAINNAIQYIQRKHKEANEQRIHNPQGVSVPADARTPVQPRAAVVPPEHVPDRATRELEESAARDAAIARQRAFYQKRNEEIIRRVTSGEKRYAVAMDYGVSPNTITVVMRNAGYPAFKRYNVRNTTKEL